MLGTVGRSLAAMKPSVQNWLGGRSEVVDFSDKTENVDKPVNCLPRDSVPPRIGSLPKVALRFDPPHTKPGDVAPHGLKASAPWLSVVVPAKNEAGNLPQLVAEIVEALQPLTAPLRATHKLGGFDILIVDDGSTDDSPQVLAGLMLKYPELQPLRLDRNVGQSSATLAGIRASRSEWIALLDADLQNHAADLVRLWDALPGHDAALGWRAQRRDVWSKRVISRWANRARNSLLKQSIKDTGCSVRIFRRDHALQLPAFHGMHRFLGPLLLRDGCRIVQVPVTHRPRGAGKSHYTIWNRSLRVVSDLFGVAWLMRRPVQYQIMRLEPARVNRPHLAVPRPHDHKTHHQRAELAS